MQPVIYVNRTCEPNTGFVKKKMVGEGLPIKALIIGWGVVDCTRT